MAILNKISDRISSLNGAIGIYYMDIDTKRSCFAGNTDIFPSMGISKFLLLIEIFRRIEEGSLRMEDRYHWQSHSQFAVPEEDYEQTVGVLAFLHDGIELTIRDLVMLMIVVSDNTAFNILLGMTGPDRVNRTLETLGMKHTHVNKFIYDENGYPLEEDNHHSVREMGELFFKLYKRQLLSAGASEEMIRLLKYHQRRNILAYYSDGLYSVAHQTGFDADITHDMGIVMTAHPFILCMSVSGVNAAQAGNIMRDIVLLCCEHSESPT
jgi:beta-lactamase class A